MGDYCDRGSLWRKWDLHVHTPDSCVATEYGPGDKAEQWRRFAEDLENLNESFAVIGINDYLFIDGYRNIKELQRNGRFTKIKLFLPVVEFRLKKFVGHTELQKINFHVIFSDELDPDVIQQQFLVQLYGNAKLCHDNLAGLWSGAITKDSLADFGKKIREAAPAEKRSQYHESDFVLGFNNICFDEDNIRECLEKSSYLKGKYLTAVGKAEWDKLNWNDQAIAEKRTVINLADFVFLSAVNPEGANNAKRKLKEANVNDLLLDCSDAHRFSNSREKDRIGKCFTWIKADCSFEGLRYTCIERDRIFLGDEPPSITRQRQLKEHYIDTLSIDKITPHFNEEWFNDTEIHLNPGLIAIIGNKGSGKSALADILAVLACYRGEKLSFLTSQRFLQKPANKAQHFTGSLEWANGDEFNLNLSERAPHGAPLRIRYIPQDAFESMCNEDFNSFEQRLKEVLFSHIPVEKRLGQVNIDLLLTKIAEGVEENILTARNQLSEINKNIVELESKTNKQYLLSFKTTLEAKRKELKLHMEQKPKSLPNPSDDPDQEAQNKELVQRIWSIEQEIERLNKQQGKAREHLQAAIQRQSAIKTVRMHLSNLENFFQDFTDKTRPELALLGLTPQQIVSLEIQRGELDNLNEVADQEIKTIQQVLNPNEPDSISHILREMEKSKQQIHAQMGETERLFQLNQEELKQWEKKRKEIIGCDEFANLDTCMVKLVNSINYVNGRLRADLANLYNLRTQKMEQILATQFDLTVQYHALYLPIKEHLQKLESTLSVNPLDFRAKLTLSPDFPENFFSFIDQRNSGVFMGREEGKQKLDHILQEIDFNDKASILTLPNKIIDDLKNDKEPDNITNQLKAKNKQVDFYDYLFGLTFLSPTFTMTLNGRDMEQLSPGEKGLALLTYYLLVDIDEIPLILDQPEENLDNESVFTFLVSYIKAAKSRRQVIMVTHNPNLAVVCDAEQIICTQIDKADRFKFSFKSGAIENPEMKTEILRVLEGTRPAFDNRKNKYD